MASSLFFCAAPPGLPHGPSCRPAGQGSPARSPPSPGRLHRRHLSPPATARSSASTSAAVARPRRCRAAPPRQRGLEQRQLGGQRPRPAHDHARPVHQVVAAARHPHPHDRNALVTAMTRRSGQDLVTERGPTWESPRHAGHRAGVDPHQRRAERHVRGGDHLRGRDQVRSGDGDRPHDEQREPNSAQPVPATIASPASAMKAARQRDRGRRGHGLPNHWAPHHRAQPPPARHQPAGADGGASLMRHPLALGVRIADACAY